ncbi:MAG TPA: Holliday junction resolvase RuvX [Patescibacteria group bacterium]
MEHENYLALDIGEKRIGVAVGTVIPFGRGTVDATEPQAALNHIASIIREDHITALIVGIPHVRSGDVTASQAKAHEWIMRLKEMFSLPIETVDEAYSSTQAERELRAMGVDTVKEKERIDERSAEIILAQYLEGKV